MIYMEWLTVKQVAERFDKNLWTVRQHVKRGKFGDGLKKMGESGTDINMIHIDAARRLYGKEKTKTGGTKDDKKKNR